MNALPRRSAHLVRLSLSLSLAACASSGPAPRATAREDAPARLAERLARDALRPPAGPRRVAVLIGAGGDAATRETLSLAYQVSIEQGFAPGDVFVLEASGASPLYPLTDVTSPAALELLFRHLAEHLTSEDTLFVFVTGPASSPEPSALTGVAALVGRPRPRSLLVVADVALPESIAAHVDGCGFAVIESAPPGGSGASFTRAFLSAFRERSLARAPSILDAFRHAMATDRATAIGQHRPRLVEGCLELARLGLAGALAAPE